MKKIYTVRPGDTLGSIARGLNIGVNDLLALNPQITNPNLIRSGQQIVLPDGSDRSALLVGAATETAADGDPLWLSLALREEDAGVAEFNPGSNPRIVEYLATCKGLSAAQRNDDNTAWCSAFVNWCMVNAGKKGTDSAWALDWRGWGVEDPSPKRGSVVVWERIVGGKVLGHVSYLLDDQGAKLLVLGGNQSNRVHRALYPRDGKLGLTLYRNPVFRKPA
ncbi:LysM peptidoglycan-binding domain-containing protein [Sphingomonas populi]|uniref:LysM peptidoglycan-binding domain-containing protein n=1 Tax=Sphingomonas populi TaxID=2484750 RepID=A0A4Q6Y5M2_9SPHN|nr:LysM peptidoglycan-binding domain-containing protein [Sphingomonas populi]RZF64486.1 LysM peptidoglycan-binding domain-containing protein [Sphingomonas populi]